MCFYWKEIEDANSKKELSLEEIKLISKKFKNLPYLSITGGEPILREDLSEIAYSFYAYSNTRFINITTNGLLPEKTRETVSSILRKCPEALLKINVSIDHFAKEENDKIRGVKGAFEKAVRTFQELKTLKAGNKENLLILITTVLSSCNKDGFFGIIDYVRDELKPDGHNIALARGDARERETLSVEPEEYRRVIDYVKNDRKTKKNTIGSLLKAMMDLNYKTLKFDRMILPCVAGKRILTVTETGTVLPCEALSGICPGKDFAMGALRDADYDIARILKSQKAREVLGFIRKTKCHCTFECASLWNIILNPRAYPEMLKAFFR